MNDGTLMIISTDFVSLSFLLLSLFRSPSLSVFSTHEASGRLIPAATRNDNKPQAMILHGKRKFRTCGKCSYAYNRLWSESCEMCDAATNPNTNPNPNTNQMALPSTASGEFLHFRLILS